MPQDADSTAYTTSPYLRTSFPTPGVIHVEINRPDKLNAFIEEMWQALPPLFRTITSTPTIRAVILSGAGPRAFSTGLDIHAASANSILSPLPPPSTPTSSDPPPDPARIAHQTRNHILNFQACLTAVADCPKPVIAVLHGYCLGLGIDLALCADVRFCTKEARFAVKEVDIGIAADVGTLTRLPKVVGSGSWVKDVCLSGRVFGVEEAGRVGLVSWVGEGGKEGVMGEAVRWAETVAGKSPVAVVGTKELLAYSMEHGVQDGLRYTAVWNSAMLQSRDPGEAIEAGLRKRKGVFAKL